MAHDRGRGQAGDGEAAWPPQRVLDRPRLRRLLDGVVAVSSGMDTRTVLHRIVEAATDLVAARYGALGVLSEGGEVIDLITVGVDEQRLCAAMGLPQGHGLLHSIVDEQAPLRVADVAGHPHAVGFPAGHPVMRTLLGVPLMVRGTVYGDLYLADKLDGTPFDDDDEGLLMALASAAGVSLENARLYEQLKRAAEHLQRGMLPVLPDLSPFRAAARYEPASDLPRLGGDWYDAMMLPDGATCVVVGDVTGHDVEAAPLMGQIRNMLRAIAVDRCGPPDLIVSRLDHALTMFDEPPMATLLLGRIERVRGGGVGGEGAGGEGAGGEGAGGEGVGGEGVCGEGGGCVFSWSNAGHLPPLLLGADGGARYLAPACHGIPVGIDASVARFSHEQSLGPGDTLLLFTDGLVERRDQDIDTGLADLAEQAALLAEAPLEELCDTLIGRSRRVFDDDVALLALRIPADSRGRAGPPA
ncbi:SpoIIE family protein phosphatase [Nonomuraea phyllanthi]|uniref:PP2C family protein-serine/threonine phosphatase n=1 Tax=Nonomuraea phyllanthi TaxID=2219224 RepID=UPI0012930737|nr:GAF domain-containing SpoIIE family protein phosphatase [Nonomuraea phyllanthi]QFY09050.1 SpoIIE family protein phosphatase [Nonomuraea phyllanthi]